MPARIEVTEGDLLAAVHAAEQPADEGPRGFTAAEFARAAGVGPRMAHLKLRPLLERGILRAVMVRRKNAWDRWHTYPGYQLATPAPAKRAARR